MSEKQAQARQQVQDSRDNELISDFFLHGGTLSEFKEFINSQNNRNSKRTNKLVEMALIRAERGITLLSRGRDESGERIYRTAVVLGQSAAPSDDDEEPMRRMTPANGWMSPAVPRVRWVFDLGALAHHDNRP